MWSMEYVSWAGTRDASERLRRRGACRRPTKAFAGPPQIDGVLDALKRQGDDGAQEIQWSSVVVTREQYDAMNDPFKNVLGASLVDLRHGHGLIAMPNSSILEMYRPAPPRTPWRNAGQPLAIRYSERRSTRDERSDCKENPLGIHHLAGGDG